jgi:NADH:ubiquinone oxidoreductase subunit 3 (subunit A)
MTEKITVVVPCACGETARQELTLEEAQLYAVRMLVMALDVNVMDLLPVQVGGE